MVQRIWTNYEASWQHPLEVSELPYLHSQKHLSRQKETETSMKFIDQKV